MYQYFKRVSYGGSGNHIYSWKSKGLSYENIKAPTTNDYKLNPELSFFGTIAKVGFNASCLKQDNITYNHGKEVNIYIVYEISKDITISDFSKLEYCLFGAVSLTRISANILDMELDLTDMNFIHTLVVKPEEM